MYNMYIFIGAINLPPLSGPERSVVGMKFNRQELKRATKGSRHIHTSHCHLIPQDQGIMTSLVNRQNRDTCKHEDTISFP